MAITTKLLKLSKIASVVFWCCATFLATAPAQTFSTIASFDRSNGSQPFDSLVQGIDGNFYGTTYSGGNNGANNGDCAGGCGTVFEITPEGTLNLLYAFCSQPKCKDGEFPFASLVLGRDGNFYGTTSGGLNGVGNSGTLFSISHKGRLTTLYEFCSRSGCEDGSSPTGTLVQGTDGDFYGTTESGGSNNQQCSGGCGTVFKITRHGTLTTLYNFCTQPNCQDGSNPFSGLVQATDGNFYGVASYGGVQGVGTVFKITPTGAFTMLYSFCSQPNCADGLFPNGPVLQASDANLYGTTNDGGGVGTVFKISLTGEFTTIYTFCSQPNCADGFSPVRGLMQSSDGNLYGTTLYGGTGGNGGSGTAFKITPAGILTTLYNFCSQPGCTDGAYPVGPLTEGTNGNLYGLASQGGNFEPCQYGCGTVFSLGEGLGPFVEPQSTSGNVEAKVSGFQRYTAERDSK